MKSPRLCTIAVLMLSGAALAGPLTPPAGPIAPTMKTLDQVEPRVAIGLETTPGDFDSLFRITQPGSYYLTGNVVGEAGKAGIEIAASGVTIDLGGFELKGSGQADARHGIKIEFGVKSVTVRHGTVSGWAGTGINLTGSEANRIEGVTVSSNGNGGLRTGTSSIVERCIALANTGDGIFAADNSSVSGCTSSKNTGDGFRIQAGSAVEGCTADHNGEHGFEVSGQSVTRGSSATSNGANGFHSSDNAHILDCVSTSNDGHGIRVSSRGTVERCTSNANDGDGINASSYCVISNNSVSANALGTGIGAGIRLASGSGRSVVRDNNCSQNGRGILVEGVNHLVIGNTCTSNSINFDIVSGNRVGSIMILPTSGAIFGSTGGTASTTDPMSNFSY